MYQDKYIEKKLANTSPSAKASWKEVFKNIPQQVPQNNLEQIWNLVKGKYFDVSKQVEKQDSTMYQVNLEKNTKCVWTKNATTNERNLNNST